MSTSLRVRVRVAMLEFENVPNILTNEEAAKECRFSLHYKTKTKDTETVTTLIINVTLTLHTKSPTQIPLVTLRSWYSIRDTR